MPKIGIPLGKMFGKKTVEETEESRDEPIEGQIYLKAMKMRSLEDIDNIKKEIKSGNILIIRFTPLAENNIEDVKAAINELYEFTLNVKGDIARLGEDRIVITPEHIKIWREK